MHNSYKIGYMFFRGMGHKLPNNYSIDFCNSIELNSTTPSIEDKTWKEWVGSLRWNNIIDANMFLKIKVESETPDILNNENRDIEYKIKALYKSLQLLGNYWIEVTTYGTGSETNGAIDLRSLREFRTWFRTDNNNLLREKDVPIWSRLYKAIIDTYANKTEYRRLKRGLFCFCHACELRQIEFRLPQLVRSLEALVLPDQGKTRKQFISRITTLLPLLECDEASRDELGNIYDIRCSFDHLHGLNNDQEKKVDILVNKCERIARKAYQHILLNNHLLEIFINDKNINIFWGNN